MRPFTYEAPTSIEGAIALLAEKGGRARPFAGGTDLFVQMRLGLQELDSVVDVKRIPELRTIAYDPHIGLSIGAAVTCAELGENPAVQAYYPGLWDGAGLIGGSAIQGRATIGGNLCNAAPSGDSIPAMIVLGATAKIAGSLGTRTTPVAKFCLAPRRTALQPDELLVGLHLPPPQPHAGARYVRFTPRAEMDIAVAGAWVQLNARGARIEAARVALSAVAPTPLLVEAISAALSDRKIDDNAIAEAAHLAQEAACPIADVRGGVAQRKHLVGVLVRRALLGAIQRARGEAIHD